MIFAETACCPQCRGVATCHRGQHFLHLLWTCKAPACTSIHSSFLFATGGLQMSDNQAAAHEEEEPSRLQASAKRMRHMKADSPDDPTQGSAVSAAHAVHAEPSGSTTQSPQPAAAAARCVLAAHTSAMHCCCIMKLGPKTFCRFDQIVSRLTIVFCANLSKLHTPSLESYSDGGWMLVLSVHLLCL